MGDYGGDRSDSGLTFAYCDDLSVCDCVTYLGGPWEILVCYDRNALHRRDTEWNSVEPTVDDQPMAPGPEQQEG